MAVVAGRTDPDGAVIDPVVAGDSLCRAFMAEPRRL